MRRRVVNRFSSDIDVTDNQLAGTFTGTMQPLFQLVSVVIVVEMAVPEFLLFYVPVMYFYIKFARIFRQSGREIKRLNSHSRSPVFQSKRCCSLVGFLDSPTEPPPAQISTRR